MADVGGGGINASFPEVCTNPLWLWFKTLSSHAKNNNNNNSFFNVHLMLNINKYFRVLSKTLSVT